MFIGIDDTDSLKGMCTTYLGALLFKKLNGIEYPRLIRLNPNIPFKTRGNGAISFEVDSENNAKETTLKFVEKYSHFNDPNTNPGVVFVENMTREKTKLLNNFYYKTISELVTLNEAERVAKKVGAEIHKFKNGRGIIGALAAIGAKLNDHTYELLAYRYPDNFGKKRKLYEESVFKMNEITYPRTFDNIDIEAKRILITPRGYDPIFCGIRGESPHIVKKAFSIIQPLEKINFFQIFDTNQGTDIHLRNKKISEVNSYDCVRIDGLVSEGPKINIGGHIFFKIKDTSGEIFCAAYKQTGSFRNIVLKLIAGDTVKIYGGLGKYLNTVNLEKIEIIRLAKQYYKKVPRCCKKAMTSAGKGKGYKCKKCGKKAGNDKVVLQSIHRDLKTGIYEVPPSARRHLSKPLIRC